MLVSDLYSSPFAHPSLLINAKRTLSRLY
uniref:Uncharacterized protein n=1 Tax=Anguilla anguilla TaxID=7936 RepID=A0A0E9RYJ6_ANGAN